MEDEEFTINDITYENLNKTLDAVKEFEEFRQPETADELLKYIPMIKQLIINEINGW